MAKILILLSLTFIAVLGNFYFTTHPSYRSMMYITSGFRSFKVAGDTASVTQQCRRYCALTPKCRAFNLTLLNASSELGVFRCRVFLLNACNWNLAPLQDKSIPDAFDSLWEKLEAAEHKPKPCVEYCAVKYRGNCTACRGYEILSGLDCDEAPGLCSDYPSMTPGWILLPIWPWGFYGRQLKVKCRDRQTPLIIRHFLSGTMSVISPGLPQTVSANNVADYVTAIDALDWELLSELQALSTHKTLSVYFLTSNQIYNFSGFHLRPDGALTLNASLDTPPSTGFPTPLSQAPFVNGPFLEGGTCGPFWQLEPTVDVCAQRTNLLHFGNAQWDGVAIPYGVTAITFS